MHLIQDAVCINNAMSPHNVLNSALTVFAFTFLTVASLIKNVFRLSLNSNVMTMFSSVSRVSLFPVSNLTPDRERSLTVIAELSGFPFILSWRTLPFASKKCLSNFRLSIMTFEVYPHLHLETKFPALDLLKNFATFMTFWKPHRGHSIRVWLSCVKAVFVEFCSISLWTFNMSRVSVNWTT